MWAAVAEATQGLGYVITRAVQTLIFSRLIHLYFQPASLNEGEYKGSKQAQLKSKH